MTSLTTLLVRMLLCVSLTFKQQLQQNNLLCIKSMLFWKLVPEKIKLIKNKMRIIGNDVGIKEIYWKNFLRSAGRNNR